MGESCGQNGKRREGDAPDVVRNPTQITIARHNLPYPSKGCASEDLSAADLCSSSFMNPYYRRVAPEPESTRVWPLSAWIHLAPRRAIAGAPARSR